MTLNLPSASKTRWNRWDPCWKVGRSLQDLKSKVIHRTIWSKSWIKGSLIALDPLLVGDLGFNRGYEMKFTGMQAYGLSTFKVEKVRVNLDKKIKVKTRTLKFINRQPESNKNIFLKTIVKPVRDSDERS